MRIISGTNKGKKLFIPDQKFTRPLKDLVKESIFNFLEHSKKIDIRIQNSNILDLFAGSGSFGLECISRGAKSVYFFENHLLTLKVLKKNINLLKNKKNSKIFETDVIKFILSKEKLDKKFDIIFIDPPFKESKINQILENLLISNLLAEKRLIIFHRHKNEKVEITKKLHIFETRTYGISKIFFGC